MADAPNQVVATADQWNNNLPHVIAGYCNAVVESDFISKHKWMSLVLELAKQENVDIKATISILKGKNPLTMDLSAPMLCIAMLRPLGIDSVDIESDLNISMSQDFSRHIGAETKVEADAHFNTVFGGGGVKVTASATVAQDRKRHSDMRAHVSCKIHMAPQELPEGMARIVDSALKVVDAGCRINESIMGVQAGAMAQEKQDTDGTQDNTPDGGQAD